MTNKENYIYSMNIRTGVQPQSCLIQSQACGFHPKKIAISYLAIFILTTLILFSLLSCNSAMAYEYKITARDKIIFRNAYSKSKNGQYEQALKEVSAADDKTITKLIKWLNYQDGYAKNGALEIINFLDKNPTWPNVKTIKNRIEYAFTGNEPATDILAYFNKSAPVTGVGMRLFAETKIKNGTNKAEVAALLKQSWQQGDFSKDEVNSFLNQHGDILTKDDIYKRVDNLLWQEEFEAAKRLYPLLSDDKKNIMMARIKLNSGDQNAIGYVAQNLRNDPGLIYALAKAKLDKENYTQAYNFLNQTTGTMPEQAKWWKLKNRLIRELLDENKIQQAYDIAKNHGNEAGSTEYPEAEWLAGWIMLRFLNNPGEAYKHFYNMYNNVKFPVSLSRAAYWAGRAAEANNNQEISQNWYELASEYSTNFYGQLSYIKLYGDSNFNITSDIKMGLLEKNGSVVKELLSAAYILESSGQSLLAERFIKATINAVELPSEMSYIAEFGARIGRPNLAVSAAKEALNKGVILIKNGWPETKYMPGNIAVEKAFALSIIRQESMFNQHAMSPAKAMGLMQLIPATAKRMAKSLGLGYNQNQLLNNPEYNIKLGSHYLSRLVADWDNSYILAIASYNAGPGNAKKWVNKYGDPTKMDKIDDVIDWIESIPFNETRNYVQRVLENLQVYRTKAGGNKLKIEDDLLRGT